MPAFHSPTNRRYYTHEQYLQYRGLISSTHGKVVAYARVSSPSQKKEPTIQEESFSPEEELVSDLLAIVTMFSARLHGLRSHTNALRAAALGKE